MFKCSLSAFRNLENYQITANLISDFIEETVTHLESHVANPEKLKALYDSVEKFRDIPDMDFEMAVENLFSSFDPDSSTLRLLRGMTQSLVFIGCFHVQEVRCHDFLLI